MSKNRTNMQAGMRALLGGGDASAAEHVPRPELHEVPPAPQANRASHDGLHTALEVASQPDEADDIEDGLQLEIAEQQDARAPSGAKRAVAINLSPNGHQKAGTIETPVLRGRDQKLTRKLGVVLPIDLIARVKAHCLNPEIAVNLFIETALEAELRRVSRKPAR
ncbi:MAG: hypothetical protein JWN04_5414 [Myxococcaceae bacterium]|nr:hypothetical protein [Myxococcaceae bacterium]